MSRPPDGAHCPVVLCPVRGERGGDEGGGGLHALPDAVITPELRVDLPEGAQTVFMARLMELADLKGAALTTIDGLRADFEDGWGLVRASNTTPSLILRFEANTEAGLKRIKEEFRALMKKVDPAVQLPF